MKKNFKMIWNISDLSLRDWIWERITSKHIVILYTVYTVHDCLTIFYFQGTRGAKEEEEGC